MNSSYLVKQLVSSGWDFDRSLNGGWMFAGEVGHQFGRFSIYLSVDLNIYGDFIEYLHIYYNPRDYRTEEAKIYDCTIGLPIDKNSYDLIYQLMCDYRPIFVPEKKEDINVKLTNLENIQFGGEIIDKLSSGHRVVLSFGD
jgi:hypothetical protein